MINQTLVDKIFSLKNELKGQAIILGHHYQKDEVIQFADYTGDSLELAKKAQSSDAPYIIFCGVHFVAETADMLTTPYQTVILPDLEAGCPMANMANVKDLEAIWDYLKSLGLKNIIPVTYVNSTAAIKAFVGREGGVICTSSNAAKVIRWAQSQGDHLLFLPDQHLGRNTCHFKLGIPLEEMVMLPAQGLNENKIREAKVILWDGYCSVHQGFQLSQIKDFRSRYPEVRVIVHPECNKEVVHAADTSGSTSMIIETIKKAPAGTTWAVGTEINLVRRIAREFSDKRIFPLSEFHCQCNTMNRTNLETLYQALLSIKEKRPINVIKVSDEVKLDAMKALDRMLKLS